MNEPLMFGLFTEREVLSAAILGAVFWALRHFVIGWASYMRSTIFTDWGRGYRFLVAAVSGTAAAWLSGQTELTPNMTLLMIICCLACYWAVTTQRAENKRDAIKRQQQTHTGEDERDHAANGRHSGTVPDDQRDK